MPTFSNISNGESGLSVRNTLNQVINYVNTGITQDDKYVTGGTYNSGTGTLTLNRQNGSVNVSGFLTGVTETQNLTNVLAIGNTTGSNNIVVEDGQSIQSVSGNTKMEFVSDTNLTTTSTDGSITLTNIFDTFNGVDWQHIDGSDDTYVAFGTNNIQFTTTNGTNTDQIVLQPGSIVSTSTDGTNTSTQSLFPTYCDFSATNGTNTNAFTVDSSSNSISFLTTDDNTEYQSELNISSDGGTAGINFAAVNLISGLTTTFTMSETSSVLTSTDGTSTSTQTIIPTINTIVSSDISNTGSTSTSKSSVVILQTDGSNTGQINVTASSSSVENMDGTGNYANIVFQSTDATIQSSDGVTNTGTILVESNGNITSTSTDGTDNTIQTITPTSFDINLTPVVPGAGYNNFNMTIDNSYNDLTDGNTTMGQYLSLSNNIIGSYWQDNISLSTLIETGYDGSIPYVNNYVINSNTDKHQLYITDTQTELSSSDISSTSGSSLFTSIGSVNLSSTDGVDTTTINQTPIYYNINQTNGVFIDDFEMGGNALKVKLSRNDGIGNDSGLYLGNDNFELITNQTSGSIMGFTYNVTTPGAAQIEVSNGLDTSNIIGYEGRVVIDAVKDIKGTNFYSYFDADPSGGVTQMGFQNQSNNQTTYIQTGSDAFYLKSSDGNTDVVDIRGGNPVANNGEGYFYINVYSGGSIATTFSLDPTNNNYGTTLTQTVGDITDTLIISPDSNVNNTKLRSEDTNTGGYSELIMTFDNPSFSLFDGGTNSGGLTLASNSVILNQTNGTDNLDINFDSSSSPYITSTISDGGTTYTGGFDITHDTGLGNNNILVSNFTTNFTGNTTTKIECSTDLNTDTSQILIKVDDTIQSVGLNITSTSIELLGIPSYDDDAAASGLTTGQIYQTTGNGANPLDVAGILMVKQ